MMEELLVLGQLSPLIGNIAFRTVNEDILRATGRQRQP